MDKQTVLMERMSECGISCDSILKEINHEVQGSYTVVVYISKFDGLGNRDSDFDVYVLMDDNFQIKSSMLRIGEANCDIEYWVKSDLISRIQEIRSNPNRQIFKVIKRLQSGIAIFSTSKNFSEIEEMISGIKIDNYIYKYYRIFTNAEYDDAVRMYKNKEYISSLICCQRSMHNLVAAINAQNGFANLNLKWAPYIFIKNQGYGNKPLLDHYMDLAIFSCIDEKNIQQKVEQMLDFLTTEINRTTLF